MEVVHTCSICKISCYDSFMPLLVCKCKDLRNGMGLREGCSRYIRRQLRLRDEHVYLWLLLKPSRTNDWQQQTPPLSSARAIWPTTSGKRPQASRDIFHLYSPELRIPSLCGQKKVAICRRLETPWTCLYPQDELTLSSIGHIQSRPSLSRAHPIEHVFSCLYLDFFLLGIINLSHNRVKVFFVIMDNNWVVPCVFYATPLLNEIAVVYYY